MTAVVFDIANRGRKSTPVKTGFSISSVIVVDRLYYHYDDVREFEE